MKKRLFSFVLGLMIFLVSFSDVLAAVNCHAALNVDVKACVEGKSGQKVTISGVFNAGDGYRGFLLVDGVTRYGVETYHGGNVDHPFSYTADFAAGNHTAVAALEVKNGNNWVSYDVKSTPFTVQPCVPTETPTTAATTEVPPTVPPSETPTVILPSDTPTVVTSTFTPVPPTETPLTPTETPLTPTETATPTNEASPTVTASLVWTATSTATGYVLTATPSSTANLPTATLTTTLVMSVTPTQTTVPTQTASPTATVTRLVTLTLTPTASGTFRSTITDTPVPPKTGAVEIAMVSSDPMVPMAPALRIVGGLLMVAAFFVGKRR
jgi:hypothetical protein